LDSNAPIASLATKNSRNALKTIFDRSKAVHPPIVGTIVKKKGRSMGETKADNINDKKKINITKRKTTSAVHNMNQSTSGSKSKRTRSSKNSTNESGGKDPFFGTHVAFSLAKETGKKLICELGNKLIYDAVCFDLDDTAGHIVGIVMRHQKGTKGKGYQVVWEYSALGESCLPLADILEGHKEAEMLMVKRSKLIKARERSIARDGSKVQRFRPGSSSTANNLQYMSEDEVEMRAPSSDESCATDLGDFDSELDSSWAIVADGKEALSSSSITPLLVKDVDAVSDAIDGLHWEYNGVIHNVSDRKMKNKSTSVKADCHHFFQSPVSSMMAIFPLVFWNIIVREINRYATQKIKKQVEQKVTKRP